MADPAPSHRTLLVIAVTYCHDEPISADRLNAAGQVVIERTTQLRPDFIRGMHRLPVYTDFPKSPNDDGWTLLVALEPVTDAQKEWIRRHWQEAEQQDVTYNRIFQVPVSDASPTPQAFRAKPEVRRYEEKTIVSLVLLLARIIPSVDGVASLCRGVSPTFANRPVYWGSAALTWNAVIAATSAWSSTTILDELLTVVRNDHATPEQRTELAAFLDPV